MLRQRSKLLAVFALIGILALTTVAQEQGDLQSQMEEQLEQMRASGQPAFRGVLLYPQPVRKALLELAQHPELVVKLLFFTETLDKPVIKLYEVLGSYPKEVQDAGRLMVFYPDVLKIMQEYLVLTGLIGKVYQDDKAKVLQQVTLMAEKAKKGYDEAIDTWAERLDDNPEAVEQLLAALKAYADQTGRSEQLVDDDTGMAVSEAGELEVSGLPDVNFVTYTLDNSEQYPYLTEEMLEYYEDYYDDDYHDDYHGYPVYHPYDYRPRPVLDAVKREVLRRHLENRPVQGPVEQRLRNQFAFEDEFANARQSRADINRDDFLRENTARFPNVQKRAVEPRTRTATAETPRRTERAKAKTEDRTTARAISERREKRTEATARAISQRRQKSKVQRREATQKQQINRARSNHQKTLKRSADRSRRKRSDDRRSRKRSTDRPSRR